MSGELYGTLDLKYVIFKATFHEDSLSLGFINFLRHYQRKLIHFIKLIVQFQTTLHLVNLL